MSLPKAGSSRRRTATIVAGGADTVIGGLAAGIAGIGAIVAHGVITGITAVGSVTTAAITATGITAVIARPLRL